MVQLLQISDVYALRLKVLRKTQDVASVQFPTDSVQGAFHLGFISDNQITTVASFSPDIPPANLPQEAKRAFRLRGMATDAHYQGKGQGRAVCLSAEAIVRAVDGDAIWANARVGALPFYIKLGYEAFGEGFDIPGVGLHYRIFKQLG